MAASYCCPGASTADAVKVKQGLEYFTFIVSFIPHLTFIRKVYYSDMQNMETPRQGGDSVGGYTMAAELGCTPE